MATHGIVDSLYIKELAKKTHRGMEGVAIRGLHTDGRCFGYVSNPIEDPTTTDQGGRPKICWNTPRNRAGAGRDGSADIQRIRFWLVTAGHRQEVERREASGIELARLRARRVKTRPYGCGIRSLPSLRTVANAPQIA